jgi:nitroimidazol reductase NimA-like FMN-containing flavoprotein (pyridoxamine 5'-phosphate oxidase superfamily)
LNLATTGNDGYPHVVPVAFMFHEGRLYISTGKKSRKVNNIRGDSHVAFAVEDSTRLKAIVGKGTARILPSHGPQDEIMKKLVIHLVGSLEHPYAKLMMGENRVIIEIVPTAMKKWESPPA